MEEQERRTAFMTPQALLDILIKTTIYSEPASDLHRELIKKMWVEFTQPTAKLSRALILDIGAGDGFAVEMFNREGHCAIGVNLDAADVKACRDRGLACVQADMHKLTVGDNCFDFCHQRHCLEHSPFPMLALSEAYRVLKPGGWYYVEVPTDGTKNRHEENASHWSLFSDKFWVQLLLRSGFDGIRQCELTFTTLAGDDRYLAFLCQKPSTE